MGQSKEKSVETITLGCRLNIFESEVMRQNAENQGLENVIIINTCAVTNEAERQSRQAVRKAHKQNPGKKIIVTGCSAQLNPDVYSKIEGVDKVLGNHEKMQKKYFKAFENSGHLSNFIGEQEYKAPIHVTDIMTVKEGASHLISGFDSKIRAFIEVQNGCNHRCTFCTIPLARGNNRSVPVAQIVNQVNLLVKEERSEEIVFTGVDITDYGGDLPGKPSFTNMLERVIESCPDMKRLRLSSLDPAELDDSFFDILAKEKKIMPHLHISLQHGDDLILTRMKRRHRRQDIIDFCAKARSVREDVLFGCDIIAGFPTETDEHFEKSLDILKTCNITFSHVFPYSIRANTPAARMPQVKKEVIHKRSAMLRNLAQELQVNNYLAQINTQDNVLVEENNIGYGERYTKIQIVDEEKFTGVVSVNIIGYDAEKNILLAENKSLK